METPLDLVWIQTSTGPKRVWRTRPEQRQSWLRRLGQRVEHLWFHNVAAMAFLWKFCQPQAQTDQSPKDQAHA